MSLIKIKRSSGTSAPIVIEQGELAYTYGAGAVGDGGGRLYFGTGSNATQVIGGKYFTDMLDQTPGTLTASSAIIVDSSSKIDNLKVDNLDFNGNTISTTSTNGDLIFDTNGNGDYIFSGSTTAGANVLSVTDGTSTTFSVDSFSGATTITSPTLTTAEQLLNISSTWNGADQTFYGIKLDITNTASDPTSRLLDLLVGGTSKFAVDTDGNVTFSGTITSGGGSFSSISITDNISPAFTIKEGTNEYFRINTTDGSELTTIGNSLTSLNLVVEDNTASAFAIKEGTNVYFKIDTTNGSELTTINTANVVVANDLAVNGGDLTSTSTTFNLLNSTVTTLSIGGAATTASIGATGGSGILTLKNDTTKVSGDLQVDGGDIIAGATTFNLLNGTATTINFGGAATTMNVGDVSGTVTFNNDVVISGDLTVNGDAVTVNTTSLAVEDPLIRLGIGNNVTDALDMGFIGSYGDTTEKYTGFFRDASNSEYYVFNGAPTTALSNNIIDRNSSGFILAKINASEFVGMIDGGTY